MERFEIGDHILSAADIADLLETDHPMVERFRFVAQGSATPDALSFALVIEPKKGVRYQQQRDAYGRRVQPAWHVLTGREEIGQGKRSIYWSGSQLVAENQTFFPNQEFNDLGIGSALYVAMERFYRHLGIRRVGLFAVDVGVYVWARQAFTFEEPGQLAANVQNLERYVHALDTALPFDSGGFHESWDVANFDCEGRTMDGYRLGKHYMLEHAPVWSGTRNLNDEASNRIAEASRRETFTRLPDKIVGATGELATR